MINFSHLKMVIVDEADYFFERPEDWTQVEKVYEGFKEEV